MGIILEHLHAHRDNVAIVNLTDVTIVTTTVDTALVVMDPVDTVVQPVIVNQPLFPTGLSRFDIAYPWGMPHNSTPQFASENPFVLYRPFDASSSNRNYDAFLWGMPNHFSAQGVETEETRQPALNVDNVEDQEPEYMGQPITFQIPS